MSKAAGLDLSKFKKVAEDGKTSVLKHRDGHELKIAHSGLSPKMREDLKKLPLYQANGPGPLISDDTATATSTATDPAAEAPAAASDGEAPATGKDASTDTQSAPEEPAEEPLDDASPAQAPDESQAANPYAGLAGQGGTPPGTSPGGPLAPAADAPVTPTPKALAEETPEQQKQDMLHQNDLFKQDLDLGKITPKTYGDLLWRNKNGSDKGTLGKLGSLFGLMLSGAGSGLAHQPNALMEMMNKTIQNDIDGQKATQTNAHNLYQLSLQHERQLVENKLTMAQAKLANAQTGAVPATIELTQAQTREANMRAEAGARVAANNIALHHMVQLRDKLPPGSPAQIEADKQLAMLSQGVNNENYNIIDRAAVNIAFARHAFGGSENTGTGNNEQDFQQNQNYLRASGQEAIARDNEGKHLPGVPGKASAPLSEGDKKFHEDTQQLTGALGRLKAFAQQHPNPVDPRVIATGQNLAAQVQSAFQKESLGGVYRDSEKNYIQSVVPDPTKFVPSVRVIPKLDSLINETQAKAAQFYKTKGFPVNGPSGGGGAGGDQDALAKKWAADHPKDPRAAKLLKALGGKK